MELSREGKGGYLVIRIFICYSNGMVGFYFRSFFGVRKRNLSVVMEF